MGGLQAIADRVGIKALRGEFTGGGRQFAEGVCEVRQEASRLAGLRMRGPARECAAYGYSSAGRGARRKSPRGSSP
ncbi:hypothetical protein [Streptomyces sp. NPDC000888]